MRTKLVRTVSFRFTFITLSRDSNNLIGGQIGHRKYDCPEQRNFTANIICRVCGNAGHMARDCPDRQRGSDWRNNAPGGAPGGRGAPRAIGTGDAVDREMEVSFHFSLNPPFIPWFLTLLLATHERTVRWCSRRLPASSY